jgi:hypothetical protein
MHTTSAAPSVAPTTTPDKNDWFAHPEVIAATATTTTVISRRIVKMDSLE